MNAFHIIPGLVPDEASSGNVSDSVDSSTKSETTFVRISESSSVSQEQGNTPYLYILINHAVLTQM